MLTVLPAFFTIQSLQAPESWGDLKGVQTETSRGCNLWLLCGGKGRFDDGVGPT